MVMKAVIYARYSSHNQREESIEGQLRECYDYASKNNLEVIDEYIDRALSGKTDNRPSFQKLIKDSEKKKFEAVIMYTLDRFARNRYDSAIYKAKLKKNGVKLHYAKQPMPDTPEGIILESVLEGYAEYYSANLSRGIKRGMKENALKCKASGSPILGYKIGNDHTYVIDETGARAVKEIFEMYASGYSKNEIIIWLNDNGFKTARGKSFQKNSLEKILKNEKYIGIYKYDDVVVENGMPKIIDKRLFDKVQDKLKRNYSARAKNKANEDYLLTGKVFCGACGKNLVGDSGTSRNGTMYYYYKCANRKREKSCTKHTDKKEWLEDIVVNATIENVLTDKNIDKISKKTVELMKKEYEDDSTIKSLEANYKDTNRRYNNLLQAVEDGIKSQRIQDRIDELEKELKSIEKQIAKEQIKKPLLSFEAVKQYLLQFKSGDKRDIEYKRRLIDTLVNAVYVNDKGEYGRELLIIFNTSGNNHVKVKCSDINRLTPPYRAYPNQRLFALKSDMFVLIIKIGDVRY